MAAVGSPRELQAAKAVITALAIGSENFAERFGAEPEATTLRLLGCLADIGVSQGLINVALAEVANEATAQASAVRP